jgi:hypothetical protein
MNRQDRESRDPENPTPESNDDWSACSPGTIGQLHDRLAAQRKRQAVIRIGGPALMFVLLGIGVWSFIHTAAPEPPAEFNYGGVTCSHVQENLQQFAMNALDPAEQKALTIHLKQCPVCQKKMKALQDKRAAIADNEVSKCPNDQIATDEFLLAAIVD